MTQVKRMESGNCYSMVDNGKVIRFRLIQYTSIDNTYIVRLCNTKENIAITNLTTENVTTLREIDCKTCDGQLSASDQLKE